MKSPPPYKTIKALAAATLPISGFAQATVLQLAPINSLTTTYNDFQIQSLYLNDACASANDMRCKPSGPNPVQSGPGQTADQTIILTGSNGQLLHNITSPPPWRSSPSPCSAWARSGVRREDAGNTVHSRSFA